MPTQKRTTARIKIPTSSKENKQIQKTYFQWLCGLVCKSRPDHNQRELLWMLHQKEFYCLIPNDDNRISDGMKLRENFADARLEEDCTCLDGSCTVLEMLVALAQRIDYILFDPSMGEREWKWFWEMIDNLGLEPFSDTDDEEKIHRNEVILDNWLARKYTYKGVGGLFPLKKPSDDQRKVEIWYQMMAYIGERYEN